jgi:hypothetical protein
MPLTLNGTKQKAMETVERIKDILSKQYEEFEIYDLISELGDDG